MLEENPMLELTEEVAFSSGEERVEHEQPEQREMAAEESDHGDDDGDVMEWNSAPHSSDDDNDDYPEQAALQASMREHLHAQLAVSKFDDRDKLIIGMLIDALDERGYMAQDLAELAELLQKGQEGEQEITLDDLETALVQLQYLDLPGIGARDLGECLALQLKALPEDTPERDLAIRLVTEHLDLVAAHDFSRIKKLLRCSDEELRRAQNLILSLNPKPGEAFDSTVADFVVPDVIVEKHRDRWRARLNTSAMPKLRVNQLYASLLHQRDEKTGSMAAQLQEASWLVKSLRQRFETILQVAQAIVERQGAFLEHGEIAMRPLVLREIADALELHESTVSRATTQKFMRTPRGIYEFKYFFGSGLVTESGGICSSASIRELIKQLISGEDPCKPLTDGRMSEILAQQGFKVARRTIAKYREAMHILPVNLRKTL